MAETQRVYTHDTSAKSSMERTKKRILLKRCRYCDGCRRSGCVLRSGAKCPDKSYSVTFAITDMLNGLTDMTNRRVISYLSPIAVRTKCIVLCPLMWAAQFDRNGSLPFCSSCLFFFSRRSCVAGLRDRFASIAIYNLPPVAMCGYKVWTVVCIPSSPITMICVHLRFWPGSNSSWYRDDFRHFMKYARCRQGVRRNVTTIVKSIYCRWYPKAI